jgi:hypothetical protein
MHGQASALAGCGLWGKNNLAETADRISAKSAEISAR